MVPANPHHHAVNNKAHCSRANEGASNDGGSLDRSHHSAWTITHTGIGQM